MVATGQRLSKSWLIHLPVRAMTNPLPLKAFAFEGTKQLDKLKRVV
jgi:hypothetical protein